MWLYMYYALSLWIYTCSNYFGGVEKGGGIFQTKRSRSCVFLGLFSGWQWKQSMKSLPPPTDLTLTLAEIGQWLMVTQITDNTGLPNCWNMQKAIIKEFYTKERKLSLYTPIEDINVLIKWYIGSDVAKWELGIITECGLVICLLWRAFLWLLTFDILIQLFYKGIY